MIDMRRTVIPKSDQLNADDLINKTMTIKITKISLSDAADQPIAINFEGDGEKPYKPCKSMRRVLIFAWGDDGNKFIGRSMTLYRDPKVMFGGFETGGIRISHMSDIESPLIMALTATRASRKPFTVKPLVLNPGEVAARSGTNALRAFWTGLSKAEKEALGGAAQLAVWKAIAETADTPDADDFDDQTSSPALVLTPAARRDEAAADGTVSVETGAEPTNDLEGSAPDPQPKSTEASVPHDDSVPASSPTRPQAGAERPSPPEAVSAPATSSTPSGEAADDPDSPEAIARDRAARIAAIKIDGAANAGKGEAALNNYLEELVASGERSMIENVTVREWRKVAREIKK